MNFTIAQLGNMNRAEADNALGIASKVQRAFSFESYPGRFPLDTDRYKLPNGGLDLEAAATDLLKRFKWPRPLILMTSAPYTDRDYSQNPDYFFFSGGVDNDDVTIISTYGWDRLPGTRRLQTFILYQLAQVLLARCSGLSYHFEMMWLH